MNIRKKLEKTLVKSLIKDSKMYKNYLFYKKHKFMRFIRPIKYMWLMMTKDIWLKSAKSDAEMLINLNLFNSKKD